MTDNNRIFIEGLKKSDRKVFKQIFETWYDPLLRFCSIRLGNSEDAEEIVQDIFVKLWIKRDELQINSSLRSYLYRTALNRIINHQEHLKIRLTHREYVLSVGNQSNFHSENFPQKEISDLAAIAVSRMPARRRSVYELSRHQGLTYAEIANRLNISIKTVEAHLSAALEDLRVSLKDYLPVLFLFTAGIF
jgi:RNA polymerase sigma-70 factor (ECF subfamily)